jgi:hypothetical protein
MKTSSFGLGGAARKKMFFFEKKNQKTFAYWLWPFRRGWAPHARENFPNFVGNPTLVSLPVSRA